MKRLLPLLLLGACVPDIPQNPPPAATVVAQFNPDPANPSIPTPNDLAADPTTHIVTVPPSPGDSPAQKEFDADYLSTLAGFPFESTAQVNLSGPLDRTTVNAQNVFVVDLSAGPAHVTAATPVLDATGTTITIPPPGGPPGGAWTRGHQYAVALIAGQNGLKGVNGEPVVGSPAWELVRSTTPLVQCQNQLTFTPVSSCKVLADIVPATGNDPQARLTSQVTNAINLEKLRVAYQPLFNAVQALRGLADRSAIALAWSFTIVDGGEVTFDPADRVIPFPNDVLRSGGKVTLPDPTTGGPLDCSAPATPTAQIFCGLNTLDGFSTTVAPISENGDTVPAVAQAELDATEANWPTRAQVGLVELPGSGAAPEEKNLPLEFTPCIDCVSSAPPSGAPTPPQQLQWRLDAPLTEKTTYLAYVTNDMKDKSGKGVIANPIFALVRLKNPIYQGGKSQVSLLTDAQAAQLEPLRAGLSPALDALAANGVPRSKVALAWAFTTQSEGSLLDQLYAYGATQQTQGIYVFAEQTLQYQTAAMTAGAPFDQIGKVYFGLFMTPVALTGPGGTLDVTNPRMAPVSFALAVPDPTKVPAPSAAGYPITIFGHGITRDRNDFIGIANTLASAGQATIATDVLDHGERSSCTGSGAFLGQLLGMSLTDDAACANPTTQKCNEDPLIGRCVARDETTRIPCPGLNVLGPDMTGNLVCLAQHRGLCEADGKCEGGDFARDSGGRPLISGWNIFSLTNFFSTRDNFRQQVIDLATLVHTLHVTPLESKLGGTLKFDLSKMNYVGQSLGGILGTLFNAVSPDTTNVVLNVPGGDLVQIILQAPSFAAQKALLLQGLAAQGLTPGTPAFDSFIGTAQWILDPADPANLGWRLTHPVTLPMALGGGQSIPAGRNAFIQFIEGDQTVPNVTNLALVAAADRPFMNTPPTFGCTSPLFCYEFTEGGSVAPFDATSVPADARHGFLLKPPADTGMTPSAAALQLTAAAQKQVATFLSTGHL